MNKFKIVLALFVALFIFEANTAVAQKNKGKKGKTKAKTSGATTTTSSAPMVSAAVPDFEPVDPPVMDSLGYNTLSVRPVHKSDLMYKMAIWRKLDLQEKCNTPWFSQANQISKFLVEAVNRGDLTPYKDDSLVKKMSKEAFQSKLEDKTASADAAAMGQGKVFLGSNKLYLMEIKEDLLFDKQRSRSYYDIQTISMILPAKYSGDKGAELPIATFKYKDVVKLLDKIPNAKWYNISNKAEDKRMSDAFDLRLFCSRIIKMANPGDRRIEEEVAYAGNTKAILIASQRVEHEIVSKENDLWDY
jgi:gliding motility associated protien GldN